MLVDEGHHLLPQGGGGFQTEQDLLGHVGTDLGMSVIVGLAHFVLGAGGGLAGVVEQCRPAEGKSLGHGGSDQGRVGEKIVDMVVITLVVAQLGLQLRDHLGDHRGKTEQIFCICQQNQFT